MARTKTENLFYHAVRRLRERYGMELTRELHKEMVVAINKRRSMGCKRSCRIYLTWFNLDGTKFYVVFDRKRQALVSFLTQEMFKQALDRASREKRKVKTKGAGAAPKRLRPRCSTYAWQASR